MNSAFGTLNIYSHICWMLRNKSDVIYIINDNTMLSNQCFCAKTLSRHIKADQHHCSTAWVVYCLCFTFVHFKLDLGYNIKYFILFF